MKFGYNWPIGFLGCFNSSKYERPWSDCLKTLEGVDYTDWLPNIEA